ncbi:MAG TPA: hypothetical protein VGJ70_17720 [Solirubrobacteraceae bacterium]
MRLAQAWRRRGMWATAATLVVPGALAIAVAVTLLGGGLRGFGAAGQVVTGPAVPETSLADSHVRQRSPVRLPTVPSRRPLLATSAPAGAPAGPRVAAPTGGAPLAIAPQRRRVTPVSAPSRQTSPPPASSSPASPPRPANPVRDTGEQVAQTVGTVPAPAGPAGQDAITTAAEMIPPPPAGGPPAGAPPADQPPARRPAVPTPSVPAPSVPRPSVPLPAVPTPAAPALPGH